MEKQPVPHNTSSDEIDLIELISHIWNGRWLIAKVTVAFFVLGLLVSFTSTVLYRAEAKLLPEIRDTRGGASSLLRQFGSLSGLSVAEGADAIRPDLYPDVLKSTPFFAGLMEHSIIIKDDGKIKNVPVLIYLDEHMPSSFWGGVIKYTIKLPWTVMGWIKGSGTEEGSFGGLSTHISEMTQKQFEAIKTLRERIGAGIDQKSGIITVNSEFSDPRVAAQITQYAVDYLKEYITEYRIQKAQKDLVFVEHRYEEKKQDFHNAQLVLARFRDANRNIISAAAQTEEQRLQDQYNLAYNVYNGLAQQLEQARIKVQEETPVIKVLEPVQVPVQRIKPRRTLILVVFTFLGAFLAVGFILGRQIWISISHQLKAGSQ